MGVLAGERRRHDPNAGQLRASTAPHVRERALHETFGQLVFTRQIRALGSFPEQGERQVRMVPPGPFVRWQATHAQREVPQRVGVRGGGLGPLPHLQIESRQIQPLYGIFDQLDGAVEVICRLEGSERVWAALQQASEGQMNARPLLDIESSVGRSSYAVMHEPVDGGDLAQLAVIPEPLLRKPVRLTQRRQ